MLICPYYNILLTTDYILKLLGSYPQTELTQKLNYDDIATRSRDNTTYSLKSGKSPSPQNYSFNHEVVNPIHDEDKVKRLSIIQEGDEQDGTEIDL